jgi:hypothetical protein
MALKTRAKKENWTELRTQAEHKINTAATQKIVNAAADNAVIAADLKKRLLLRLQRIEDRYPFDATEVRTKQGNSYAVFRIRDLTAAYKDLTEDITTDTNGTNELLQSLIDLERGRHD